MKRLLLFVVGIVIGGAAVYGSLEYHVVRTADGFVTIRKVNPNWSDTYVDVRSFGVEDWTSHKDLVQALIAAKKQQVFGDAAEGPLKEKFSDLFASHADAAATAEKR
jgi:hypothetical protein